MPSEAVPIKIVRHYPNDIVVFYKHQDVKPFKIQFKNHWKKNSDIAKFGKFIPKIIF